MKRAQAKEIGNIIKARLRLSIFDEKCDGLLDTCVITGRLGMFRNKVGCGVFRHDLTLELARQVVRPVSCGLHDAAQINVRPRP